MCVCEVERPVVGVWWVWWAAGRAVFARACTFSANALALVFAASSGHS
jgi:hypothetical protein